MKLPYSQSRRRFLKTSAVVGSGLVIGFNYYSRNAHAEGEGTAAAPAATPVYPPNAFIRIAPDESVTLIINKSEMGQGIYTALAMLMAEELECDWSKVRVESAPAAPVYKHTVYGAQITGGSSSVSSSWEQLRTVGAKARQMLIAAAAKQWNVDPATCHAEQSVVKHEGSDQTLSYGALAEAAEQLPMPDSVTLKPASEFRLIGKSTKRLDAAEKVTGKGQFGLDVYRPDMLTVVVARSPVFGGKVRSFNAAKAMQVKGVVKVVKVPTGIAVAADGYWTAKQGRDALEIEWDEGANATLSTESLRAQFRDLAKTPGLVTRQEGAPSAQSLAQCAKQVEAEYEVPYLAHACMEPLNCVVELRKDSCEIWTGTQFQTGDQMAAAAITGLSPERVQIHTMLLGGGFGRRANPASDFVSEAVLVAKALMDLGKPVKVVWSREDDMHGGYYRPQWISRLIGGIDANGNPLHWQHTIVGQSIITGTPFEAAMVHDGIDPASVEGAADLPYAIPNLLVDLHTAKMTVPVLWWRSVGHSHTGFVTECYLDELARAAGKDPVEYRRALLAKAPHHLGVLNLAAEKAGWGTPLLEGHARGVAVHKSFDSYVAQVAEVSIEDDAVRVHRVVCAVDCGIVVNPDTVVAQMESAIAFGLSAALHSELTFKDGRIQQSNFHDYQVLRFNEMPAVEVHIVPSAEPPTGVGEPGVPPIAPAVANALYALTGKPVRKLPIVLA
jgi:isoquinoline 1-oxidoreductase beta subunit